MGHHCRFAWTGLIMYIMSVEYRVEAVCITYLCLLGLIYFSQSLAQIKQIYFSAVKAVSTKGYRYKDNSAISYEWECYYIEFHHGCDVIEGTNPHHTVMMFSTTAQPRERYCKFYKLRPS